MSRKFAPALPISVADSRSGQEGNAMSAEHAGIAGEIMQRIDALAAISETPEALTRRYLTPQHRDANDLVSEWMRQAGMSVREDAAGNLVGRYEGERGGLPALMLGSHLDTVVDAGRFDGMLGVVTAIACVDDLARSGRRFPFAVEVIAFGDEEGARFSAALLGSRAVAGTFDRRHLSLVDDEGVMMAEAMTGFGLDPGRLETAARNADEILAYVELHIEQGPVLERTEVPVGVVSSIMGATRMIVTLTGAQGHAGTVPMELRRDALAGAAEAVVAVERMCGEEGDLVGTVGRMDVRPGAVNVIPGEVSFSIDVRSSDDRIRQAKVTSLRSRIGSIGKRRNLRVGFETVYETQSTHCAPQLMRQLADAVAQEGFQPVELTSGAGHDAVAMADLVDVAMLFVRCADGISHSPEESVAPEDVAAAARVLSRFIDSFATGCATGCD
jgi:allantoate deiminase